MTEGRPITFVGRRKLDWRPRKISRELASLPYEHVEICRTCSDRGLRILVPADFIVWGKMFSKEQLGPRCTAHLVEQHGWDVYDRVDQYAIFDLRTVTQHGHSS